MTTFHLSSFLASLATGLALPLRFEVVAALLFTGGVVLILLNDYTRPRPTLRTAGHPRTLRPRARFRPLPLAFVPAPDALEVRPVSLRLRAESHRLAA